MRHNHNAQLRSSLVRWSGFARSRSGWHQDRSKHANRACTVRLDPRQQLLCVARLNGSLLLHNSRLDRPCLFMHPLTAALLRQKTSSTETYPDYSENFFDERCGHYWRLIGDRTSNRRPVSLPTGLPGNSDLFVQVFPDHRLLLLNT